MLSYIERKVPKAPTADETQFLDKQERLETELTDNIVNILSHQTELHQRTRDYVRDLHEFRKVLRRLRHQHDRRLYAHETVTDLIHNLKAILDFPDTWQHRSRQEL